LRLATWGVTWAFATVNAPFPKAVVSHAFVADSSAPICQPPVAGDHGAFVEVANPARCEKCFSRAIRAIGTVAQARSLDVWTWAMRIGESVIRGTAGSREEAEKAASGTLPSSDEAICLTMGMGGDAAEYARELRAEAQAARPSQCGATAPIEYVFQGGLDWDDTTRNVVFRTRRMPVVRTTEKLVFVEHTVRRTTSGALVVTTIALDRAALERGEKVRGWSRVPPSEQEIASTLGRCEAASASSPSWATTLGIAFPCTADEVRRAFRRAAKAAHPDAGGSAEVFRAVAEAFEQASQYFSAFSARTVA
jgi:hypothetical protein